MYGSTWSLGGREHRPVLRIDDLDAQPRQGRVNADLLLELAQDRVGLDRSHQLDLQIVQADLLVPVERRVDPVVVLRLRRPGMLVVAHLRRCALGASCVVPSRAARARRRRSLEMVPAAALQDAR